MAVRLDLGAILIIHKVCMLDTPSLRYFLKRSRAILNIFIHLRFSRALFQYPAKVLFILLFTESVYGANTVQDFNGKISIFDRCNQIDKLTSEYTLIFVEFTTNCTHRIWRSVHFILILHIQPTQQLLVFGHRSPLR